MGKPARHERSRPKATRQTPEMSDVPGSSESGYFRMDREMGLLLRGAMYGVVQEVLYEVSRGAGLPEMPSELAPSRPSNLPLRKISSAASRSLLALPHILRQACGLALADQGADTRFIQDYLGHRAIQHTVKYTATNPARFEKLWR